MTRDTSRDWMFAPAYEPRPLPPLHGKSRGARRFWLIFGALAILAVICGALAAFNQ